MFPKHRARRRESRLDPNPPYPKHRAETAPSFLAGVPADLQAEAEAARIWDEADRRIAERESRPHEVSVSMVTVRFQTSDSTEVGMRLALHYCSVCQVVETRPPAIPCPGPDVDEPFEGSFEDDREEEGLPWRNIDDEASLRAEVIRERHEEWWRE